MSVFEDLIDELKNENLLEETVVDLNPDADEPQPLDDAAAASEINTPEFAAADDEGGFQSDIPQIEKPSSDQEFFRKRAMDEVSSLQMVEHVLSGVEREYLKVSSDPFDDLNAKRALHAFLQVSGRPKSPEHAEAEFELRHETESWNLALYERDRKVSVANIRRFCEDSRPVLSSQALVALGRFYRNSPYSEEVRGKFDYVMTRLFSRNSGEETRVLLFAHDEMVGHIHTLYGNWSSIALYTSQDDQVEVSLTLTRFHEFIVEVENAASFDELLETDFFARVRVYKEESAEMFYVPEVLAAAINCNLAIGNRYVELIGRERLRSDTSRIEEKYGDHYDQMVSNAAGRTLTLADVLELEIEAPPPDDAAAETQPVRTSAPVRREAVSEEKEGLSIDLFGVNKWLMAFCLALILAGGGVYLWAEKFAGGSGEAVAAKAVEIEDPEIKKFLQTPRSAGETLFVVTEPAFETLTEDQKIALLGKVWQFAESRKLEKVNVLSKKGRSVAFASKDRLELVAK
ncbi:MAG: hypothetical protein AB7F88_14230 [Pyrinomonadaceae bacterium]